MVGSFITCKYISIFIYLTLRWFHQSCFVCLFSAPHLNTPVIYCHVHQFTLGSECYSLQIKEREECRGAVSESISESGQTKFDQRCHMTSVNNCPQLLSGYQGNGLFFFPPWPFFSPPSELLLWRLECQFSFCKSARCLHLLSDVPPRLSTPMVCVGVCVFVIVIWAFSHSSAILALRVHSWGGVVVCSFRNRFCCSSWTTWGPSRSSQARARSHRHIRARERRLLHCCFVKFA